jgi:single-stranded DNA-binding protein
MIPVTINGIIVKTPQRKISKANKPYTSFEVDHEGKVFPLCSFGITADQVVQMRKGQAVQVHGELIIKNWVDKMGAARTNIDVRVNSVELAPMEEDSFAADRGVSALDDIPF